MFRDARGLAARRRAHEDGGREAERGGGALIGKLSRYFYPNRLIRRHQGNSVKAAESST
jgi:hypothetical protein